MNFENWFTYISYPTGVLAQLHWNVSSVFTASTCLIIWTSKCGVQDTRIAARLFSITSCHVLNGKGSQGVDLEFLRRTSQGAWGQKSPSGVQGQSPGRGSGRRSPREAETKWEISSQLLSFTCTKNIGPNKYRRLQSSDSIFYENTI